MRRHARFVLLSIIFISILGVARIAFGAEEPSEKMNLCPDFGNESVGVSVALPGPKIAAGALLPVKVVLENKTEQPLAGGALLVRLVAKSLSDKSLAGAEGTVVSRFVAFDNVSLPARKKLEKDFSLSVSPELPKGNYELQTIYALSEEYNLANPDSDVALSAGNVAVTGIYIDNDALNAFAFIDARSVKGSDATDKTPVSASVTLVNPGSSPATVPVLWKAYSADALSEKYLLESRADLVTVPPQGRKIISFEAKDASRPYYQIVVQADSKGARSMAAVPLLGTKGGSLIRLAGIAPFPTDKNEVRAYACVHNIFTDDTTERSLRMTVETSAGKVMGEGIFPIPQGISEFEAVKSVPAGAGDMVLLASVISSGSVEQIISKAFRCNDFGGCAAGTKAPAGADALFALTVLAAGTGGLITMRYYLKHVKRNRRVYPDQSSSN